MVWYGGKGLAEVIREEVTVGGLKELKSGSNGVLQEAGRQRGAH